MEGRVRRTRVKATPATVFRASLGHRRPGLKYKDYKDQSSSKAEYPSSCAFNHLTSRYASDPQRSHHVHPSRAIALVSLLRVLV